MSSLTAALITLMNTESQWVAFDSQNPMSMNYCIDVNYTTLQNNDILGYDVNNASWINKPLSSVTTSYNNADGGYYYETYAGVLQTLNGGVP